MSKVCYQVLTKFLCSGGAGDEGGMVNGDAISENGDSKHDIIVITGKPERCEAAKQALLVSKACQVPLSVIVYAYTKCDQEKRLF